MDSAVQRQGPEGLENAPKNPGKWRVERGILIGGGKEVSHLFSERGDYQDFHYRIEAKISDKGNSGQYLPHHSSGQATRGLRGADQQHIPDRPHANRQSLPRI